MTEFQTKIVKDRKDELEIEFKEVFFKKSDVENLKILGEEEWHEGSKKGLFYKEVPSKELAEALGSVLNKKGIDAYAYEPHPLSNTYRLKISGKNPKNELKKALKDTKKEWVKLEKLLLKKLK